MDRLRGEEPGALETAARLLRAGGLVAVPTETVYGLAADATNESAVRKIFSVKGRPLLDPLIVHFASMEQVASVCEVSEEARLLARSFWPGPLTLVLPRRKSGPISDLVSAGKPTIAVRIPAHRVLRRLLCESGLFLAAPSANPFGYISPTRPEHVEASLREGVSAVLDGGHCEHGVESTIVALTPAGGVRLLRPGPISREELLALPGIWEAGESPALEESPTAPGMLKSHYRPTKGIVLFAPGGAPTDLRPTDAVVSLRRPVAPGANDFWLSETGEAREIARNLFDLLRRLDEMRSVETVFVEMPDSENGVLRAVRDRLARAATPPG